MTDTQTLILAVLGGYFILMILFGIFASRREGNAGFVIGNRNVGYIPTIGSVSAGFRDGMGVVFWFGFAATAGYGGFWLFVGVIVALLLVAWMGPKARELAARKNYITIGEMMRARLGPLAERFTALIIVAFSLLYIAVQLNVSGTLFATVLGVAPAYGIWAVAAVVGFYLFFGGYGNVVRTDTLQFFFILALILVPFFLPPPQKNIMDFASFLAPSIDMKLGLVCVGLFFVLGSADMWQRVFSARSDHVIRTSFPLAGVFLFIMTLSLVFLGMASAPHLGEDIGAANALYLIFEHDFIAPWLLAFIALVVMAVCMSTLDTLTYLTSATVAKNFLNQKLTDDRKTYIRFSQIIMVFVLIGMSVVAQTIGDVILFLFSAASLMYVLAPIYLLTVLGYPRRKSRMMDVLITLSVAVSVIVYLAMFTSGAFDAGLLYTMAPVAVCTALCLLSLAISPRLEKRVAKA